MSKIKITVIGAGYVGMSLAVLLSKDNNVSVLDIDESKVKLINAGNSTIEDPEITKVLENKTLTKPEFFQLSYYNLFFKKKNLNK